MIQFSPINNLPIPNAQKQPGGSQQPVFVNSSGAYLAGSQPTSAQLAQLMGTIYQNAPTTTLTSTPMVGQGSNACVEQPIASRTAEGQRVYPCSVCKKEFRWSANRNRHMRIHTGQRPYRCEYCQRGFCNSSNRRKHERSCGSKDNKDNSVVSPVGTGSGTKSRPHTSGGAEDSQAPAGSVGTILEQLAPSGAGGPQKFAHHLLMQQPPQQLQQLPGNQPMAQGPMHGGLPQTFNLAPYAQLPYQVQQDLRQQQFQQQYQQQFQQFQQQQQQFQHHQQQQLQLQQQQQLQPLPQQQQLSQPAHIHNFAAYSPWPLQQPTAAAALAIEDGDGNDADVVGDSAEEKDAKGVPDLD